MAETVRDSFHIGNRMAHWLGLCLCLSLLALSAPMSRAGGLPGLEGAVDRAECRIALEMAQAAFRSTSPTLQWPVPALGDPQTRIVLARNAEDITGGDGLHADPAVFERRSMPGGREIVFWQRQAQDGQRLAVVDLPFNWQGDWYRVFTLSSAIGPEGFAAMTRDDGWMSVVAEPNASVRLVLGDNRWSPPVVLEDEISRDLWLIDPGEVHEILPGWVVLVSGPEGLTPVCTVRFVATDAVIGLEALPGSVQRFAALADEALGPGLDEGTLQPTARIRLELRKSWALATERPWALTSEVHNTRAEVDAGLRAWAKGVPARQRLLRALTDSQGEAEQALAHYYRARFGLSWRQSRVVAGFALDYLLRSHFHFRVEVRTDRPAVENPWPVAVREVKEAG